MSIIGKLAKEGLELAVKKGAKTEAKEGAELAVKRGAPAILKSGVGKGRDKAADVLAVAAKKKGKVPFSEWERANADKIGDQFDYSALNRVPKVPQTQMTRYNPKRGTSARISDALSSRRVKKKIDETVERGAEGGGMAWYNTEPLLERLRVLRPGSADEDYARLMDLVAATSPRSRVTDNIRTASYYNYLAEQGLPIANKPAPGYGSVAQKLHAGNAQRLRENGGWDVFKNPKPASFSSNLQGNQNIVTIDTHNFRLPGILSEDPRFLATSVKAGTKGDADAVMNALSMRFPGLPDSELARSVANFKPGKQDLAAYRPQEWVKKGYVSPDAAAQDPVLWSTKPNNNEYGYYEKWQQDRAKRMGMSPAQYQASMWLGGGDDTGLGSAAEPFLRSVEARVKYTADMLGMDPDEVLEGFITGSMPMLAEGGRVDAAALAVKRRAARR